MVRTVPIVLTVLLCVRAAFAADWSWGGTLRLDGASQASNETSLLNPGGRLFDVATEIGQGVLDFRLGGGPNPALDFTLKNRVIATVSDDGDAVDNVLEDAYVAYRVSPRVLLVLGKERVREGVGYAWNPVDFFRTRPAAALGRDPKEQRDHRPGHYVVRVEARSGRRGLALVYAPAFEGLDTDGVSNTVEQFWVRGSDLVADTDVAVYLYTGREYSGGVSFARVFGDALELHFEAVGRWLRSREVPVLVALGAQAGAVRVPLWLERRRDRLVGGTLLGAQYTFRSGVNLIAEYFYNGDGLTGREWRTVFDGLALARRSLEGGGNEFTGRPDLPRIFVLRSNQLLTPGESGQHYAFVRASGSVPLGRGLALSGFALVSVQDGSGTLSGEARYGLARDVEAVLGLDLFYGARRSEFGSLPVGSVVRASLRYSF